MVKKTVFRRRYLQEVIVGGGLGFWMGGVTELKLSIWTILEGTFVIVTLVVLGPWEL